MLSWFGVLLTLFYCIGLGFLALHSWSDFSQLKPNEWGDFLAGALGPLAIFWLVLGFFQQGTELRHSVKALKLQAEELKNSVEQQKAMVGMTEKQFKLDVEVRDEQIKQTFARELPFFQIHRSGSSPGDAGTRRYMLTATNVGATSIATEMRLGANEDVHLERSSFPHIKAGDEVHFSLISKSGQYPELKGEYLLTISSRSIRNQQRNQTFAIENDSVVLVSSNPEQS